MLKNIEYGAQLFKTVDRQTVGWVPVEANGYLNS